jgi:hypothetical protein
MDKVPQGALYIPAIHIVFENHTINAAVEKQTGRLAVN